MNCDNIKRKLVDLLYDELAAEERSAVERHLTDCSSCRAEWQHLQQGRALLERGPDEGPRSPIGVDALYRRRAERMEHSRRRWRLAGIGAGLAAAVVLLVVGLGLRIEAHPTHVVLAWGETADGRTGGLLASDGGAEGGRTQGASDRPPGVSLRKGDGGETADLSVAQLREILNDQEQRLADVEELAQLAAREVLAVDRRHTEELAEMQQEISRWRTFRREVLATQRRTDERWRLLAEEVLRQDRTVAQAEWPAEEP